jgi:hypothetical protein
LKRSLNRSTWLKQIKIFRDSFDIIRRTISYRTELLATIGSYDLVICSSFIGIYLLWLPDVSHFAHNNAQCSDIAA